MLDDVALDGVIGVSRLTHQHPARMYRIVDGLLVSADEAGASANRQDLAEVYQRNGAIYTARCAAVRTEQSLFVARSAPLVMTAIQSINIDEPFDWTVAEAFAREHLR